MSRLHGLRAIALSALLVGATWFAIAAPAYDGH